MANNCPQCGNALIVPSWKFCDKCRGATKSKRSKQFLMKQQEKKQRILLLDDKGFNPREIAWYLKTSVALVNEVVWTHK